MTYESQPDNGVITEANARPVAAENAQLLQPISEIERSELDRGALGNE